MEWPRQNWFRIAVGGLFIWMHTGMHEGHGGHGGCGMHGDHDHEARPADDQAGHSEEASHAQH